MSKYTKALLVCREKYAETIKAKINENVLNVERVLEDIKVIKTLDLLYKVFEELDKEEENKIN